MKCLCVRDVWQLQRVVFFLAAFAVILAGACPPAHAGSAARGGDGGGKKAFKLGGEELYVEPGSIVQKKVNGVSHVLFRGTWTLKKIAVGGHRSFTALFDIDCRNQTYSMPEIAYFERANGQGRLLYETKDNASNVLPVGNRSELLGQAAAVFCNGK